MAIEKQTQGLPRIKKIAFDNETEFPKSVHVKFSPKSKKLQNMIYI